MSAALLAALHATVFGEPWSETEFAVLVEGGALAIEEGQDGFILIRVAADEAEVLTLAVRPLAQRRGVGRRLVERGMEAAAAKGAQTLLLEVAEDNQAAIALYRSLGFEEVGRRPAYYRRGVVQMQDALILSLTLNSPSAFSL